MCLLWSGSQMFIYVQISFVLLNPKTFISKNNNKKINWNLFLSELYVNGYYMRFVKTLWDWSIKNKDSAEIADNSSQKRMKGKDMKKFKWKKCLRTGRWKGLPIVHTRVSVRLWKGTVGYWEELILKWRCRWLDYVIRTEISASLNSFYCYHRLVTSVTTTYIDFCRKIEWKVPSCQA